MHKIEIPLEIQQKIKERLDDPVNEKWVGEFDGFVANHFKQFQDLNLTLHHATTGVATEAGELLSVSKAAWIYNREIDHEKIIEETFDTLFYLQAIINLYGLHWKEVISYGVGKLRTRYPDGFTEEAANIRLDKLNPWQPNPGHPPKDMNPLDQVEIQRADESVTVGLIKDFDWQSRTWPTVIASWRPLRLDSKT